jgi:hypothetical protein
MFRTAAMMCLFAAGAAGITAKVTSKAQSNEKRIAAIAGQTANLSSTVAALAAGNFASLTVTGTMTAASGNFAVDGSGNITCGPDLNLTPPMADPVNYPNSHIATTPTSAEFNAIVDTLNAIIASMVNRNMVS